MFVRTQDNRLVNLSNMKVVNTHCLGHPTNNHYSLRANNDNSVYDLYEGTLEKVNLAYETLIEAVIKGASLISYYKEDIDENMG